MTEEKIAVIADPSILKNKTISIQLWMLDMIDGEIVDKKHRRVKRNIGDRSVQMIGTKGAYKRLNNAHDEMVKLGLYEQESKTRKQILMTLPDNKFVLVKSDTARQLASTLSENATRVYVYLLNNYKIWNLGKGKAFCFTKGRLCKDVLGQTIQGKNSDAMEDILTTLALNGLITYSIIKNNTYNTWYRKLDYVSEDFVLHKVVKEHIEQILNGLEEQEDISLDLLEDNQQIQYAQIGYNPKEINTEILQLETKEVLPQYNIEGNKWRRNPQPYKTLEELCAELTRTSIGEITLEDLRNFGEQMMEHDDYNEEYINYEFTRLGIEY